MPQKNQNKNESIILNWDKNIFHISICSLNNVWMIWIKNKIFLLPKILKDYFPPRFKSKYETQNIIKPNDPVLVIKKWM